VGWRRFGSKLLVLVATLLLGLAGAEAAVRLRPPLPTDELLPLPFHHQEVARLAAHDAYLRFDADLGWSLEPDVRRPDDGVIYQTNAAGLRAEREYSVEPPAGVRRVAAFGDSFTHCDEVGYQECWSARLEQAWERSEVLNFGLPASAPDQGWLRYQRDARQYHPCAVLIGFQVENVNRVVNRYRPFYAPTSGVALSKPRFLLDGDGLRLLPNPATSPAQLDDPSWVERTLGPDDFWYFPGMFEPKPLDDLVLARLTRTVLYQRHRSTLVGPTVDGRPDRRAYIFGDERFEVSGRILIQFARQAEADGATAVVVFFGQRAEVAGLRRREPKAYQPLLDWLAAEHVTVVDVTTDLAREANRIGTDRLFAQNGHYSPRGNEVISASLAEKLPRLTVATCP
jgi:hypothetical protein